MDFTLSEPNPFEEGTTVKAYPVSNWANGLVDQKAAPLGTADATAVTTNGEVAFTGLTADEDYVAVASADEIQKVTVDATAGQFKLTYSGQQTANIAYNAAASAVQSALEALSNIAVGDVAVIGGPGNSGGTSPYFVHFAAALGAADLSLMTAANGTTPLSGGGASVTVSEVRAGSASYRYVSFTPGADVSMNTPLRVSNIDTDDTLAADSDSLVPSQKAIKSYVDAVIPAARVTHDATQAIASGGGLKVLAFNTERFDSAGLHDTVTNNSRLTVPRDGLYSVSLSVQWAAQASGYRYMAFVVNGSDFRAIQRHPAMTAVDFEQSLASLIKLSAGDYIEAHVHQDSGSSVNINNVANYSPDFAVAWLGYVA